MHDSHIQARTAKTLRSLLERLGSPEITLSEANTLRCQVAQMLGEAVWAGCDDRNGQESTGSSR